VDVKGDGQIVAFKGGLGRNELTTDPRGTVFDAVRSALRRED